MKRATRLPWLLLSLLLLGGCVAPHSGQPSAECRRIRELFSRQLHTGMAEEDFLKVCAAQGWKPHYAPMGNRYTETIAAGREHDGTRHSIVIDAWFTAERQLKSYTVQDSYERP